MNQLDRQIEEFLAAPAFGVAGASDDPDKYGHKCFACLINYGRKAYPINPKGGMILGHQAFASIAALPEKVESLSIITPPQVTLKVIDDAIAAGVKNVWMQPGAESPSAIAKAKSAGMNVIHSGPCLLVVMVTQPRDRR